MTPIKQREFENKKLKTPLLSANTHLILNIFFLCILLILLYKFKDEIFDTVISSEEEVNIVMFGDSLIEEGDWNNLLNRDDIKKRGFRGFTTSHYRWILKDSVLSFSPKICFISGGINDIGAGIPLKRIKTNYKNLINTFIENKVTLVVQSTLYQENNPFSKSIVDSLNTFLIDYCYSKKIEFLDINSSLSSTHGLKEEFSKDGTHLNDSAYKVWANEIKRILNIIE